MKPGDINWDDIFGNKKSRWFHTGGIFAALSDTTPEVAIEAMKAAKRGGSVISYDLNYRPSLWKSIGGQKRAQEVNRELAKYVDVMIGNEEDFTASLGYEVEGAGADHSHLAVENFKRMIDRYRSDFPNTAVVATTLRTAKTASRNDWSAICVADGTLYEAPQWSDLEIFDRVGGGDSFASGLIYGLMSGKDPQWAVTCGAAHGALAMTTPGDTTMVTLGEVERAMKQGTARIER
jgi:2-dehydro-3-deoxygluconokinase